MVATMMHLSSRDSGRVFQINRRFQGRQMFGCERVGRTVYPKRFFQRVVISLQYKIDGVRGCGAQFDEPQYFHDSSLRILQKMSKSLRKLHHHLHIAKCKTVIRITSPPLTEGKRTIEGWSSHVFSTKNLKCRSDIDSSFLINVRRQRTATIL